MDELRKVSFGEEFELVKDDGTSVNHLQVAGGWNCDIDVDFHAIELDRKGRILSYNHFIAGGAEKGEQAYRKPDGSFWDMDPEGALVHSGDANASYGEGDAEIITVDLSKISSKCERIEFYSTIYEEAKPRKLNFGQVKGAFFRAEDMDSGKKWQIDLTEDYSTAITVKGLVLNRNKGKWKIDFTPEGSNLTISKILSSVGFSMPK